MSNSIVIFVFTLLFTFSLCYVAYTAFICSKNENTYKVDGVIMTDDKHVDTLQKLHTLYEYIKVIDMIDLTKRSLLEKIKFEIDLMERQVYMQLGKEKYEEMKLPKRK